MNKLSPMQVYTLQVMLLSGGAAVVGLTLFGLGSLSGRRQAVTEYEEWKKAHVRVCDADARATDKKLTAALVAAGSLRYDLEFQTSALQTCEMLRKAKK